ncbi:hypothetical protein HYN59_14450 [Flavobacterium album]|uniref:Uncharacterized protein n=1 Tax=Flavobacterium album TaxID=2175091 RepID=A0A2S1R0S4_9FLAO|nr:hypothetical protein [Flavobacterium album]AWH86235.1 hypothetical protein HYN59_14450 [Flavobacterium album]
MKKIFGLIALLVLGMVIGCDDGEMTFNSFNFADGTPARCGDSNIYYKINGTEVLMINFGASPLVNVPTPEDAEGNDIPKMITISGSNTITYRNYSGTPNANTLCSFPAPSSPTVVEEWSGQGTISVITDVIKNNDNIITGYSHKITLVDVSFTKDGETTRIVDNEFGSIITPIGLSFDFITDGNELPTVRNCPENTLVFERNGREALVLDFAPAMYPATIGQTTTITFTNEPDANEILFLVYAGSISNSHICDVISPISPVLTQRWSAISGTAVITSVPPSGVGGAPIEYQIRLNNVVFGKDSDESGETFAISDLVVPADPSNPGEYYFGIYAP